MAIQISQRLDIEEEFNKVNREFDKINLKIKELFILIIIVLVLVVGLAFAFVVKVSAYEYTPSEIVSIGKVVHHEAENQSELGKRLVIDTILNRVESDEFPNTVSDVLNQKGQYCSPKEYPNNEMYKLVAEEIYNRTNTQVLWYRTKRYHSYGEPLLVEDEHYFSGVVN